VSTIASYVLGASVLPFVYNVVKSYRYGQPADVDDPWGFGNSLEWTTTCPPPRHNFTELPRIRSERPAFELHYPHMIQRFRAESHVAFNGDTASRAEATDAPSEAVASAVTPSDTDKSDAPDDEPSDRTP
jgi:cytochrome c oxidase subunit 1